MPHSLRTVIAFATLIATTTAFAQSPHKHIVQQPSPERNAMPWSDAVQAGNTLYISGHVGIDPKNNRPPASSQEEAKLLMEDFKHTVEAAGMSMTDVVSVQVLCTDMDRFNAFNEVYRTYFHDGYPARAFMGTNKLLFGAHFEMTGIAIRP